MSNGVLAVDIWTALCGYGKHWQCWGIQIPHKERKCIPCSVPPTILRNKNVVLSNELIDKGRITTVKDLES